MFIITKWKWLGLTLTVIIYLYFYYSSPTHSNYTHITTWNTNILNSGSKICENYKHANLLCVHVLHVCCWLVVQLYHQIGKYVGAGLKRHLNIFTRDSLNLRFINISHIGYLPITYKKIYKIYKYHTLTLVEYNIGTLKGLFITTIKKYTLFEYFLRGSCSKDCS